jgi:hypothetical protein
MVAMRYPEGSSLDYSFGHAFDSLFKALAPFTLSY